MSDHPSVPEVDECPTCGCPSKCAEAMAEVLRVHVPETDSDKRTTPLGCAAHDEWVRWPCADWQRVVEWVER